MFPLSFPTPPPPPPLHACTSVGHSEVEEGSLPSTFIRTPLKSLACIHSGLGRGSFILCHCDCFSRGVCSWMSVVYISGSQKVCRSMQGVGESESKEGKEREGGGEREGIG